jgi:hypothetical protein
MADDDLTRLTDDEKTAVRPWLILRTATRERAKRAVREEQWRRVRHTLATWYLIALAAWILYAFIFQGSRNPHIGVVMSSPPHFNAAPEAEAMVSLPARCPACRRRQLRV